MANLDELLVDGYIFANPQDAELAKNEIRKIAYIEAHTDTTNANAVKSIFEQAIENRTFQTPIGLEYMREMQNVIRNSGLGEPKPIPLYTTFKRMSLSNGETVKKRVTKAEKTELGLRAKYRNAVLVSTVLAIMVVIMFLITMFGTTPNIINYKTAITNQYSEWEQDLSQREAIIRQKERELGINQ